MPTSFVYLAQNPNSDDFSERYGWMFGGCVGLFLVEKSAGKKG